MGVEPLTEACELAFAVARHGRESVPAVEAPAPMRSFLWVAELPPRAITVAQRVIESDEQFRLRVAAQATEAKVGRLGYLWLTRPQGWEAEYGMAGAQASALDTRSLPPAPHAVAPLPQPAPVTQPAAMSVPPVPVPSRPAPPRPTVVPAPVPSPVVPTPERAATTPASSQGAIGDELASLRTLVDRLADERQDSGSGPLEPPAARVAPSSVNPAASLERELAVANSERDVARAECQSAKARVEELQRQIESFDHERSLVNNSLSSAEKTTTAAVADRDAAIAERDRAVNELAELKADYAIVERRLRAAEQAKLDVERELSDLSMQWSTIRAEMDEIADQRLKVEAELDRLSQERADTIQGNAALIRRLADQLGRIEAERDLLAARLETARVRMTDTRSSLTEASQNIAQQLDAADLAVGEMAAAAGNLSNEVAQAQSTRNDLNALISDATEPQADVPSAPVSYDSIDDSAETSPAISEDDVFADVPHLIPPMPAIPSIDELPPVPAAPVVDEIPPMPAPPVFDNEPVYAEPAAAAASPVEPPAVTDRVARMQVVLSPDAHLDAALAAREVVQTIDIVVLVDGDAVAEMGWPTLSLADRRGAIVEYLEGLSASTGAAAHVIFDRQLGAEESKPDSKAIRVELTLPQMTAPSAMAMRIDDYPVEWPVAVVSDDSALASEAASRGVSQLGNGQLLDLFIGQ